MWTGKASVQEKMEIFRKKRRDESTDGEDFEPGDVLPTRWWDNNRRVADVSTESCSSNNGAVVGATTKKQKHTKKRKDNSKASEPSSNKDFARFWAAYPRPRAKVAAKDEYAALKLDSTAFCAVLDGLERDKKRWTDEDTPPQFIPFPGRWLREQRWEEDIPADRPKENTGPSWWTSASGLVSKGQELELSQGEDESFPDFKMRVLRGAGKGPWIDEMLKRVPSDNFQASGLNSIQIDMKKFSRQRDDEA
ncbi:hypothetical protein [Robbsia andropogonis]|uniref:hypothetical protein n=1 Tax=Robbsia andropogonis TaxID=28092 RepID=UPI002A6B83EC|nr:hypothetical protein [Robbsia andropogonis]